MGTGGGLGEHALRPGLPPGTYHLPMKRTVSGMDLISICPISTCNPQHWFLDFDHQHQQLVLPEHPLSPFKQSGPITCCFTNICSSSVAMRPRVPHRLHPTEGSWSIVASGLICRAIRSTPPYTNPSRVMCSTAWEIAFSGPHPSSLEFRCSFMAISHLKDTIFSLAYARLIFYSLSEYLLGTTTKKPVV